MSTTVPVKIGKRIVGQAEVFEDGKAQFAIEAKEITRELLRLVEEGYDSYFSIAFVPLTGAYDDNNPIHRSHARTLAQLDDKKLLDVHLPQIEH